MSKPFWKFQNVAGGRAELLLYGDISDSTWWGDEVTPSSSRRTWTSWEP